jgi:uncharacterized membrane protein YdbT with pleckstrin-like domain
VNRSPECLVYGLPEFALVFDHPVPLMPDDTSPPAAAPDERTLWKGHTSQWVHFWYYLFCVLLAAGALAGIPFTGGLSAAGLVIPVILWLVRWWLTRATLYELTTQRFRIRRGILNRRLDELELYRVKDYVLEQPLFLRMMGRGNLTIVTSDASTRTLVLRAIADVELVREQLRNAVQAERDRKRVRELDIDDATPLT